MLGHDIVDSPKKFDIKRVHVDLSKFDAASVVRDVEAFYDFFLSTKNIGKLRHTLRHDPFSDAGSAAQRFFHIVSLYKVSYQNCYYILPSEMAAITDNLRSVYLLNLATAALFVCFSNVSLKHARDLFALARAIPNAFVPTSDSHPASSSAKECQIEVNTQSLILRLQELQISHSKISSAPEGQFMQDVIAIVGECFGPLGQHRDVEKRRMEILHSVKARLIQHKTKTIEGLVQDLTDSYPSIDLYDKLAEFLKVAYKSLPPSEVNSTENVRKRKHPRRDHRPRKVSRRISPLTDVESDSDGEVRILNEAFIPSQTQVPSTSKQAATAYEKRESRVPNFVFDNQEITSSIEQGPPPPATPQKYAIYFLYMTFLLTKTNSVKSYKFFSKPGKFFSQFDSHLISRSGQSPPLSETQK